MTGRNEQPLTLTACPVCQATAELVTTTINICGTPIIKRETSCVRGHRRPWTPPPQQEELE